MLIRMSKTKVIVAYLGSNSKEFDGDSIYIDQYGVGGVAIKKGKKIVGYAGLVRGKPPTHAYVVKPKKWRLRFVKV